MPPDGEYHLEMNNFYLDFREVAKDTRSAFSCLCSYSTMI